MLKGLYIKKETHLQTAADLYAASDKCLNTENHLRAIFNAVNLRLSAVKSLVEQCR